MHTLLITNSLDYREDMQTVISTIADEYEKSCYISFNDPYHIVIEMIQKANVEKEKFIIIDASKGVEDSKSINENTHLIPINDLFNVYLFLRNLIKDNGIKMMIVDSLSTLIDRHTQLPLKEMLTNLLLEVGSFRCNSSLIVFKEHSNHEIVKHLNPLIGKSIIL